MNYKLKKQLKDAGFPQITPGWCEAGKNQEPVHHPTLEELIDACGDKFLQLYKRIDKNPYGQSEVEDWRAYTRPATKYPEGIVGATPSEAVAKLWLKLNADNNKIIK